MSLYLIAHRVRGAPAFDIAQQMEVGDEVWWIIPTSGHRAYPYNSWPMTELEGDVGQGYWEAILQECPLDLPDHYETTAAKGGGRSLDDIIARLRPKVKIERRI